MHLISKIVVILCLLIDFAAIISSLFNLHEINSPHPIILNNVILTVFLVIFGVTSEDNSGSYPIWKGY